MDEKFPTEGERMTHAQVVAELKENLADLAPYLRYREQLIDVLPKNARGSLLLSHALADVCIEVGFYQAAYDELDAAIMQVSTNDEIKRAEKDEMLAELYDRIDTLPPLA